jgi:hypothetical protein
MDAGKLDLTEFVRYVLSGANFILFLILLPLGYYDLQKLEKLISIAQFFGLAALAVSIGFLLDMFKLYQLIPGYSSRRDSFMSEIATHMSIDEARASTYYSFVTKVSKSMGQFSLARRHSEWVLMVHTALIIAASAIVFSVIGLMITPPPTNTTEVYRTALAIAIPTALALLAWRLFKNASRERAKSRTEYLVYIEKNVEAIETAWRLGTKA